MKPYCRLKDGPCTYEGLQTIDLSDKAGQSVSMDKGIAQISRSTQLFLNGHCLTPLKQGGLWWDEKKTLIVSDLHLEKGSSYARSGQLLPPYDTSATLGLLQDLITSYRPECVISLGDSFHDGQAAQRLSEPDHARLRRLIAATDWVWVEGNHDPDPPAELGGRSAACLEMGRLVFRHEPTAMAGEVAGHLHPCARIAGRMRTLRRRCFISDGHRLIMPAFGAYTGGLNVMNPAYARCFPDGGQMVFAMTDSAIIPISLNRLVPDTGRGRGYRRLVQSG